MNKLTPIFLAAALSIAAGLAYAQSRIEQSNQDTSTQSDDHSAHGSHGAREPR